MHKLSAVFGKEMITLARRKRHYFARALVLFGLLLLAGVPLFVVCLVFGGVTPIEVASAYVGLTGLMLFCCGIGLYFSTISQRSYATLMSTYATVARCNRVDGQCLPADHWGGAAPDGSHLPRVVRVAFSHWHLFRVLYGLAR